MHQIHMVRCVKWNQILVFCGAGTTMIKPQTTGRGTNGTSCNVVLFVWPLCLCSCVVPAQALRR